MSAASDEEEGASGWALLPWLRRGGRGDEAGMGLSLSLVRAWSASWALPASWPRSWSLSLAWAAAAAWRSWAAAASWGDGGGSTWSPEGLRCRRRAEAVGQYMHCRALEHAVDEAVWGGCGVCGVATRPTSVAPPASAPVRAEQQAGSWRRLAPPAAEPPRAECAFGAVQPGPCVHGPRALPGAGLPPACRIFVNAAGRAFCPAWCPPPSPPQPPAALSAMPNQSFGVPFPDHAVSGSPTPLGFGFGLGASGGTGPGFGFGFGAAVATPPPSAGSLNDRTATPSLSSLWGRHQPPRTAQPVRRKRRISFASSDTDSDNDCPAPAAPRDPPASEPPLLPKRMRTGFAPATTLVDDLRSSLPSPCPSGRTPRLAPAVPPGANLFASASTPARPPPSDADELDVGLLLPSLDKGTLVSLVHSLLVHSDPSVRQATRSAVPPPTLDVALRALAEAHQHVLSALPDNPSTARPEYTWSRARARVADFASTARGLLAYFRLSASLSQQRDKLHPATAFRYLVAACERAMALEHTLPPVPAAWTVFPSAPGPVPTRTARTNSHTATAPDPIAASLVPALSDALRAWSAMLASCTAQGRVFGADAVGEWITRLGEIAGQHASANNEAIQSLASTMRSVRAQLVNLYRPSLPPHLLHSTASDHTIPMPAPGLVLPRMEDEEL